MSRFRLSATGALAWAAASFIALGLLPSTAAAVPQPVTMLPFGQTSISDTSPDGAAPVLRVDTPLGIGAFDADTGVLLGVQARLRVDPDQGLMAYRNESGGDWDSVATLRTQLLLGNTQLANSGGTGLQRVVANRDNPVVIGSTWSTMDFNAATPAALNGFVGAGLLPLTLRTDLSALIADGGGGSVAIASVLQSDGSGGWVAGPDGFTGQFEWGYLSTGHAQLSFAAGVLVDRRALVFDGAGSQVLRLHALADQVRTGVDLVGVDCSGDCAAFSLGLDSFVALAAGATVDATVQALGGAPASAVYTLWLGDTAGVGASASHRTHRLDIELTALAPVPEPGTALLLALGLLALRGTRRIQARR